MGEPETPNGLTGADLQRMVRESDARSCPCDRSEYIRELESIIEECAKRERKKVWIVVCPDARLHHLFDQPVRRGRPAPKHVVRASLGGATDIDPFEEACIERYFDSRGIRIEYCFFPMHFKGSYRLYRVLRCDWGDTSRAHLTGREGCGACVLF